MWRRNPWPRESRQVATRSGISEYARHGGGTCGFRTCGWSASAVVSRADVRVPLERLARRVLVSVCVRNAVRLAAAAVFLTVAREADASFLPPEVEDSLATVLAVFILFFVPVVLIVLFWLVHILPEKIAHKRHHPQFEAIRTLCLLSLVFGGLLWPLAWLWAYSRPVFHKMAYGTDTHPDAFPDEAPAPVRSDGELATLRESVIQLERRGLPAADLSALRADIDALEAKLAQAAHAEPGAHIG